MKLIKTWPVWAMGLFAATSLGGQTDRGDPVFELEAFIVEETARTPQETLSPLSMRMDSIFGRESSVQEVPRAVTLLSPELQELLQIDSYEDLDKYGAGMQRQNFFGLAGSAFIRGAKAGTYFNGMLRAYQRNEMPMSFGSLEGLEVIKGPVPAGYSPTLVGGSVNQRPKTPYFDRRRGSVELTLGSWSECEVLVDYGMPLMLFGKPAAFRLSYTNHRAERFYENVPNDFDSLYGAAKVKLSSRNRLFLGGELYRFQSSEIPGINRPTQELIRRHQYVIGEAPGLVSAQWAGRVVRPLLEFPYSLAVNPALFALSIPGDIARREIRPELLRTMLDLSDPAALDGLYTTRTEAEVPEFARFAIQPVQAFLAQVDKIPQDAFLYTPEYFEAGGQVLTVRLPADKVLADPRDVADSNDMIAFADLETLLEGGRLLTRLFMEQLDTKKASTYGFAMNTRQLVLELSSQWESDSVDTGTRLIAGSSVRFSRAHMLQDFDAEPFSRRDLSRPAIGANTVVAAGGQRGPDGLNYWSSFGNASQDSDALQAAFFLGGGWELTEQFTLLFGGRLENAWWRVDLPGEVERASSAERADRSKRGDTALWQLHVNPQLELADGWMLYGAAQFGNAIAPGDGGTLSGQDSFTDVELIEGGIKAHLLDDRLFLSLSAYHWDQATYSSRDAAARPLRGKGIELEGVFSPIDWLSFLGAFTAQRVHYRMDTVGFGAIPQTAEGWALNGGILNATDERLAPLNPEMVVAGVPEVTAHLYSVLNFPNGLSISGGPAWRDGYYHDMERTMRIPSHVLCNLQLRYDAEAWWIRVHVENLFNEDYWIGQEPVFAAGTLVLQGREREIQVSTGLRF